MYLHVIIVYREEKERHMSFHGNEKFSHVIVTVPPLINNNQVI